MSYTAISNTRRKARKQHPCIWCGEAIKVGEDFCLFVGVADGDFQSNKCHLECEKPMLDECQDMDEFMPYENPRGKTIGDE